MTSKFIYLFVSAALLFSACNDNLDPEVELTLTEKDVLHNYNNTQARAAAIYTYLPDGFQYIDGAMMASASDEAEHTIETSAIQKFNTGAWNALDNPDGAWNRCFNGIRTANLFLEKSDEVELDFYRLDPNPSQQEAYRTRLANIRRWKYEARFLRAYFYMELVKRYGGVPILTRTYGIGDDYQSVQRNSMEECFDFIIAECDSAAKNLPPVYDEGDLGRATRGAALALKSRATLYRASDLYNDPSWSGGYAHPELISIAGGDRQEQWDAAAQAAKAVFDLKEAQYDLATDYAGLFRTYNNAEIILARRNGANNAFESTNFPIGYDGGNSGTTPTQNLVDAYEMIDGTSFSWQNAAHAADPYAKRDPRLDYTVVTNNSQFKDRAVECWEGGRDGKGVTRATKTGYYIRKYVDPNLDLLLGQSSIHSWILIRLGEIYLNYAEAMNEAYGPTDDHGYGMTALDAVNAVRARTGVAMPAVPGSVGKEELRERIRNERRIELAFEDQRMWDVRRWMISPEILSAPIRGVNINKRGGTYEYTPFEVEKRVFERKMYFYPIPQKDINISHWPQNPLW